MRMNSLVCCFLQFQSPAFKLWRTASKMSIQSVRLPLKALLNIIHPVYEVYDTIVTFYVWEAI